MDSLHGYDQKTLGDRVRGLELLKNPDEYDDEVSDEVKHQFRHATALGIIDEDDNLTMDGKALYRKVQADACYLNW